MDIWNQGHRKHRDHQIYHWSTQVSLELLEPQVHEAGTELEALQVHQGKGAGTELRGLPDILARGAIPGTQGHRDRLESRGHKDLRDV